MCWFRSKIFLADVRLVHRGVRKKVGATYGAGMPFYKDHVYPHVVSVLETRIRSKQVWMTSAEGLHDEVAARKHVSPQG